MTENNWFLNDFMVMQIKTQNKTNEQIIELQRMCHGENNKDVAEFVRLLTFPMLNDYGVDYNFDYEVSESLCQLFYEITNYDFKGATCNPYHFQANWVYILNGFISNYFFDDSYFFVTPTGLYNQWEVSSEPEFPHTYGTQNPLVLIEAAKDNVNFVKSFNEKTNRDEKLSFLKKGMISSGNVEKLLKENE